VHVARDVGAMLVELALGRLLRCAAFLRHGGVTVCLAGGGRGDEVDPEVLGARLAVPVVAVRTLFPERQVRPAPWEFRAPFGVTVRGQRQHAPRDWHDQGTSVA
jgi:hypothetical protein